MRGENNPEVRNSQRERALPLFEQVSEPSANGRQSEFQSENAGSIPAGSTKSLTEYASRVERLVAPTVRVRIPVQSRPKYTAGSVEQTDASAERPVKSCSSGIAHARKTDGLNSHAAAASVVNLGRTRNMILNILEDRGPLTDESIWDNYNCWHQLRRIDVQVSPSGLRSRRSELVKLGFVREVSTGKTKSGRQCSIWGLNGEKK